MRPSRDEHGFTMIELMVVVAILSIVTAVAIGSYKRNPTGDDARRLSALMATAYRTAVGGGPVRADVVTANPTDLRGQRAEITFTELGDGCQVTVYRIVEDDSPSTGFQRVAVQTLALSDEVSLHAIVVGGQIGLATSTVPETTLPMTKLYFPDGTAEGFTLYLKHKLRDNATRFRVVSLPLSPTPQVFRDW